MQLDLLVEGADSAVMQHVGVHLLGVGGREHKEMAPDGADDKASQDGEVVHGYKPKGQKDPRRGQLFGESVFPKNGKAGEAL